MANRQYVTQDIFDINQSQFIIQTIDGKPFLKLGGLDSDGQRLLDSLIATGYVGFFRDRERVDFVNILSTYGENGVELERLPQLTIGEYIIRFSQAQPGKDGKDGAGVDPAFHGSLQPFSKGSLDGQWYGSLNPFSKYSLNPFPSHLNDKWYGSLLGVQDKRKEETVDDVLNIFDGKPDLVREYMMELLMEKLSDENFTSALKMKLDATEIFLPTEKVKLRDIEAMATADMSANEIISLLNLLPKGERLNINWFDGELNIPTNTVEWHGQFQLNTAYGSGDMVIDAGSLFIYIRDVPASNTIRPAADTTRAEHLDSGSPNDLINATKSNLTFTFVRRSGDNINLTIENADIVRAFQSMSTTAKARIRTAIDAPTTGHTHDARYFTEDEMNARLNGYYTRSQSDGRFSRTTHNHDGRYYTETESDARFSRIHSHPYAPSSTISATSPNVLTAIKGFSDANDKEVRDTLAFESEFTNPPLSFIGVFNIGFRRGYQGIAWNSNDQRYYLLSGNTLRVHASDGTFISTHSVSGFNNSTGVVWNSNDQRYAVAGFVLRGGYQIRLYRSNFTFDSTFSLRGGPSKDITWNSNNRKYAVLRSNNTVEIYNNGSYESQFTLQSNVSYFGIEWDPTIERYLILNQTTLKIEAYNADGTYDKTFYFSERRNKLAFITKSDRGYVLGLSVVSNQFYIYRSIPDVPSAPAESPFLLSDNVVFDTIDGNEATIYYYYGVICVVGRNSSGQVIGNIVDRGNESIDVQMATSVRKLEYWYIPKI